MFFQGLTGGILLDPNIKYHPEAMSNDLCIMGQYQRDILGKRIVLYYGSFKQVFGSYTNEEVDKEIRKVLLHEFRHHLEGRAGEKDLEIEDFKFIQEYKKLHGL